MDSDENKSDSKITKAIGVVLCFIPALYFLASIVYAILHADVYLSDLPRILRYCVGPGLIVILMLFVAFVFPHKYRIGVASSFVAILCALFAFEALLTINSMSATWGLVGYIGPDGEVSDDVKSGLPPAYTTNAINLKIGVEELPDAMLGSVPFAQVMLCSKEKKPIIYTADRYGFNNPDAIHDEPIDVMVLGDSFVEGICLKPGDDIVSQLRDHIPASVGVALRGTGPTFQLAALGRYGPVLKPRNTVIAFFEGNDWENLKREQTYPWLQNVLNSDVSFGSAEPTEKMLTNAKKIIDNWWAKSALQASEAFKRNAVLRNFAALQKTSAQLGLHYPKASEEQPIYSEIIIAAHNLVKQWDGQLSVIYIPSVDRYVGLFDSGFVYNQFEMVQDAVNKAGVPFVDLPKVISTHESPYGLYAADAHFSEEGASIAAKVIAEHVKDMQSKALSDVN